ncbi:MAG: hypothetical protein ACREXI_07430 [Caldimonas sp.]
MISRLTALAACFAVLSAATIAFATDSVARRDMRSAAAAAAPHHVQLPQVQVIGHRSRDAGR